MRWAGGGGDCVLARLGVGIKPSLLNAYFALSSPKFYAVGGESPPRRLPSVTAAKIKQPAAPRVVESLWLFLGNVGFIKLAFRKEPHMPENHPSRVALV